MPIPKSSNCRIPILKVLKQAGGSLPAIDVIDRVKSEYKELTPEDLAKKTSTGQNVFKIRIRWSHKDLQLIGEIDG
ncbi:MAG: winged helix-turn-helix domain-containing protein [Nitrososphaerales archaeon]